MRAATNRDGFALPMVIMCIGFMTAGVIAAFARTASEVQLIDNQSSELTAFSVAEAGLQQYLATTRGIPSTTAAFNAWAGKTATYTYTQGSLTLGVATVTATMIKPMLATTDTAILLVQSVGRAGPATVATATRPRASRTVSQVAYRLSGRMQVLSSWTSLSGLDKAGASGNISGTDACNNSTVLPGVAVPSGTFTGHTTSVNGDPAIQPMGTEEEAKAQIKIDWAGITSPSAPSITPDIVICKPGTTGYDASWGPCGSWPTTFGTDYWPTIVINGSAPLPTNGQGTLIVTGNLTFGGNDQWKGIIMVGGAITDNGSGNISGAVVSGLNLLKGMSVAQSSKANGTKDYNYNSCDVQSAATSQSRLVNLRNAWVDNWSW